MAGKYCRCTGQGYCAWCQSLAERAGVVTHVIPKAVWQTPQRARVEAGGQTRPARHETPDGRLEAPGGIPGPQVLVLDPLRTINETNTVEQVKTRMVRRRIQRQAAYHWLHHWYPTVPAVWGGCVVTLTRIAPRILDDDGLQSALKSVRDGVADWWDGAYKKGNDRQENLRWQYGQRKGSAGQHAVELRLEPQGHQQ